jgi:hypothetical protein
MRCGCSGSGGTSLDGGIATAPDAQCKCEPTGQSDCELQEMACDRAADCPNGWSCEDDPNRAVCRASGGSGASSGASGTAGAAASAADAGATSSCGDAGSAQRLCLPPYYTFARGGTSKGHGSTSEQLADGGVTGAPGSGDSGTSGKPTTQWTGGGCMIGTPSALHDAWPLAFAVVAVARRKRARVRA